MRPTVPQVPMVPLPIIEAVENYFRIEYESFQIHDFTYLSGGCINSAGVFNTSLGKLFIKWNHQKSFPGMFETEAQGLNLLRKATVLSIPEPLFVGEGGAFSFLITEYITSGLKSRNYWEYLGEKLADLHKNSNSEFGLDHDNYIGSLPQRNSWTSDWIEFFVSQRLDYQLKMALQNGKLNNSHARKFQLLFTRLGQLLPLDESPALMHGDLWSGNLMVGVKGEAVLVDPAVYYGHREAEIAFTRMFGGFDNKFYEAYNRVWPLTSGFESRVELYNLYPLIVHVNLFGGGYISQLESILDKYQ